MTQEYTPTTEVIKQAACFPKPTRLGEPYPIDPSDYDRWLAAHDAYIAGRTAEPTEAETWIIARALYEHYADLEFSSEVSDDEWERYKSYYIKTPMQCTEFIRAKKALDAARKAVTE